ncbi:MAG: response regulator [Pseudomonadales bacterium]|nr:response regulator [Pseudomonadales bacterium]
MVSMKQTVDEKMMIRAVNDVIPVVNIVLCEDSLADATLFKRAIARSGLRHRICHVSDQAAMEREISQRKPDIVVSDYHIPGYNVRSAVNSVKKLSPETPFVVISGMAKYSEVKDLLQIGVKDIISKNAHTALLPMLCRELLSMHEASEPETSESDAQISDNLA